MEIFEVLQHLRDIVAGRTATWDLVADAESGHARPTQLVVRIPVSDDDVRFIRNMEAMFAPVEA